MLVIGIDPGLAKTGWGIINVTGNSLKFIASGTINTDEKKPLPERLSVIYKNLKEILEIYDPKTAAVEETFVNKNALSSLKLGHARAASILAISNSGIEVSEYAATLVKKSVVGVGRAEKEQVQMMIKHILPGSTAATADAADALAVAICHANHMKSNKLTKIY